MTATTVFNDTFTGTGAITSHVPDLTPLPGQPWDAGSATCAVAGGYCADSASSQQFATYGQPTTIPVALCPAWDGITGDGYAIEWQFTQHTRHATVGSNFVNSQASVQLTVRLSDGTPAQGIFVFFPSGAIETAHDTPTIRVEHNNGAVITAYTAPGAYTAFIPGSTHKFRCELIGSTWATYLDGVLLDTFTDTIPPRSLTLAVTQLTIGLIDSNGEDALTGWDYVKVDKITSGGASLFWANFVGSHENP